jgi:hypothetical protein
LIRRTSKIFLEVIGVTVAVAAVLLAVLAWRLSSGPVSLSILTQILEDLVSEQLDGGSIDIADTILRWSPERRQLDMRVVDVRINGADGNEVTDFPEIAFRLSIPALLRGQVAPTSVELYGVSTTLLRRPTGLTLGLAAIDAPDTSDEEAFVIGPMIDTLINGRADVPMLAYLRHFAIHDASLRIVDEVNGVTFLAPKADLDIFKSEGGLRANLSAELVFDNTTGHIALDGELLEGADTATVNVTATDIVPAALARMSPAFSNYGMIDAAMSATGDLDILRDGRLKAARLVVEAGAGTFVIPGLAQAPVELKKAHIELALDAMAQRVELKDMTFVAGPHAVTLRGDATYELGEGVNISTVTVDLSAGKTTTEIPGFFEGAVTFDDILLKATLDFDNRSIDVEEVALGVSGSKIIASGLVGEGARSPALKAKATVGKIPVNEARAVWPLVLSKKSRAWVVKNLKDGDLLGATFSIDVPADMLADNEEKQIPIPDGKMIFDFNVSGATVSYIENMPPLTNVVARGLVANNRFDGWLSSANVEVAPGRILDVSEGHFADNELTNRDTLGEIDFKAAGKTSDLLALLDHEPLKLMSKFGMDTSTIGGEGAVNVLLRLPLVKGVTLDQVDFSGTAHADNISIPNIQDNLSITGGTLDIDVSRTGLTAKGPVNLNGAAPLDLVWSERFARGAASSSYALSGVMDNATRDALGLHFDKYLDGPATVDATLTGNGTKITRAKIHADLTDTVVTLDYLNWLKPKDMAVMLDVDMAFNPDSYDFSNFTLTGDQVDAAGEFVMNKSWDWMSLSFPKVQLGPRNNLSMRGRRDDQGTLTLDINGTSADVGGLLHNFVSGSGDRAEAELAANRLVTPAMLDDDARRTIIRAAAGTAYGQNDTRMTNLDARITLIDNWVYGLNIEALDEAGQPIKTSIAPAEDHKRNFAMSSSDAGFIFRTLDLAKGITGGTMTAQAIIDDNLPGSPMKGDIDVAKFRITDTPVLAKILTLGSLTGISDTLSGGGIYFDRLILPFRVTGHRIYVEEARLAGPAIGLTMEGQIDRTNDVVDLGGTLVPAYTINSVLGNVPLLGPLLIGREGEGIFGVTYAVKGSTEDPSVIANPLSAIAPGFLRRLFEFSSSLPPESALPPHPATRVEEAPASPAAPVEAEPLPPADP